MSEQEVIGSVTNADLQTITTLFVAPSRRSAWEELHISRWGLDKRMNVLRLITGEESTLGILLSFLENGLLDPIELLGKNKTEVQAAVDVINANPKLSHAVYSKLNNRILFDGFESLEEYAIDDQIMQAFGVRTLEQALLLFISIPGPNITYGRILALVEEPRHMRGFRRYSISE